MTTFASIEDLRSSVDSVVGPTPWLEITQDRIDLFADATDDHQWLHVDAARASSGPFGRTIAHGYLILSLVGRFTTELLDLPFAGSVLNYGVDRVRFPAPTPVGSRIRGLVRLDRLEASPRGAQLTLTTTVELEGAERPACVATSLFLMPGVSA